MRSCAQTMRDAPAGNGKGPETRRLVARPSSDGEASSVVTWSAAAGSGRPWGAITARFLAETRAGATTFTAVGITIMVVGCAALIIDHDHLVGQRDLLKSAADAASMAATLELPGLPRTLSDEDTESRLVAVARKYAVLNVLGNVDDLDLEPEDIVVTLDVDRAAGTVSATVQADIGETLMASWLFDYMGPSTIMTRSGVESAGSAVEAVLAIDVSNSMSFTLDMRYPRPGLESRMDIVKRAALNLVDILDPNEEGRVAVGVVPWHNVVRLDPQTQHHWDQNGWAKYPQSRRYAAAYYCTPESTCTVTDLTQSLPASPASEWQGCVDEHRISQVRGHADLPAIDDVLRPPGDLAFAQSYGPPLRWTAYDCLVPPLPDDYRYQACYNSDSVDPDLAAANRHFSIPPQRDCGGDVPPILPLTPDRAEIEAAISNLTPVGNRTYSVLGLLWGQRLLAPAWRDSWDGEVHPIDPETDEGAGVRKVIVLLTDGQDDLCGPQDPACETNPVGFPRAAACAAAKAAGSEIFVITAMRPDNVSGDMADALRACSSASDNPDGSYVFLNNSDAASLEAAFADVASQLRVVRRLY